MKSIKSTFFLVITLIGLSTSLTFAQGDPEDPEIPIDGGISILIGAAALLGGKKIFSNKKSN